MGRTRSRHLAPFLLLVASCSEPAITAIHQDATGATPVAKDERGLPRLLRGSPGVKFPGVPTASARAHLARLAPAYGVDPGRMPVLDAVGEVAVLGGTIVRMQQSLDGMPVDGGELRVLIKPDGELATASGTLVGNDTPRRAPAFRADVSDEAGAIARSVAHSYSTSFDRSALSLVRGALRGGASGDVTVELASTKKVWHRTGTHLVAAWVVEAYTSRAGSTNGDAFRTVIADDGRVLAQRSLVADAQFRYRVFAETAGELHPFDSPVADSTPHPTGTPNGVFPPYVAPALVTVDGLNNPGGAPDPWLAAGATDTRGNNVDAYADFNAPSGLTSGDFRATTTAAGTFDRVYNTAVAPLTSQAQQMAAITSLFFNINWLHDFWYDAGFTEAAGNGQTSNFGRGGVEGDAILAEAQDNANGGSRNNANMSTPSDGMPPRMQVFLWTGKETRSLAVANRTPVTNSASFGPRSFDITGQVVLAAPIDACAALTNNVTGRIVLVDRGTCSFKAKAQAIQAAGGIGMLLADNVASSSPPQMAGNNQGQPLVTIGSLSVTMSEGAAIKANVAAGTTTATLRRTAGVELDGALDSTLIAHEFGHYLHHRLQSCGTSLCGAISEGWGDFLALLLMARDGDDLDGAYPFSVYTTQNFTDDPAYFGIRRAPYSVNTGINSLSFRHMSADATMPTSHPFIDMNNPAEVHNAGEVWAAAMWEAYVAMQKAGTSFADQRKKMAQYVVAGLLLAPTDGTPTETRDAILAAAHAASATDHDAMVGAFARRGMGSCAVSPERLSDDFVGIVESSDVRGRALPGNASVVEVESCDDDNVLDSGETARIKVPVTNPGHAAVSDVTFTVTSTTPGVRVVSQPVAIGMLPAYTTMDLEVDIQLDAGLTEPIAGEISLAVTSSNSCDAMVTTPIKLALNVDERAASSATDACDAASTLWTPGTTGEPGWSQKRETALNGYWHGADLGTLGDTTLTSPMLMGDPSGQVVVTFKHRYDFEHSEGTAFDGGVIEVSLDGTTWTDATLLGATPGYTDTLTSESGNPLGGRDAFGGSSPNYPTMTTGTLSFGSALTGKQFQLRFRIGTDQAAGAAGWEIDDIAFAGIVGTPFATVVGDGNACDLAPPIEPGDSGGCCDANRTPPATGVLALGLFAFVLRRRRRA